MVSAGECYTLKFGRKDNFIALKLIGSENSQAVTISM
jgi:hypothetical protein